MKRERDCIKNKIIRHTKKCFYCRRLLLGKVIPKVFFINVRDRVMRRKKYGHTFSEMPKNVVSNFRLFLFGVWSLVLNPISWMSNGNVSLIFFHIQTKMEKVCSGMWSQAGVVYLGASRGFGLKKKFFNVVLLSILITKV